MKSPHKRICSVFVIQILIIHIHTSSCYYNAPTKFAQNTAENMKNIQRKYLFCQQMECINQKQLPEEKSEFFRNARAGNAPHMLTIDLTALRPRSKEMPVGSRHKSPINLLGVDISVLAQSPDPNIPIVRQNFDLKNNEAMIEDNFDPRYDRLPRLNTVQINNYSQKLNSNTRNSLLYPFQHLPLNLMTTYYFIMKNKKHEKNRLTTVMNSRSEDSEKKYAANFILHLLYHLSSNYSK
ncbi:uncharacterized protein TNIN_117251 [Trichonephila inaurata madagascariensis]|uniref:Uncharacterized protein n=2 Tax=Trichonephila inaurata madagascariensis TaxID=2747483 RepID=A0A8X6Y0E8_9ARAC|nr:uncharacterized protein TNIN_117251 [Trichonephila inaurata madagascariensis]